MIRQRINAWLDVQSTRRAFIGPYSLLAISAVLAFVQFGNVSERRTEDVQHFAEVTAYTQCIGRVSTRDDLRSILLGILSLSEDSPGVDRVTQLIETDYPALSIATCGPVPEN